MLGRDGSLRGLRLIVMTIGARLFGMTDCYNHRRLPKPNQRRRERKGDLRVAQEALERSRCACLPQRPVAPEHGYSELRKLKRCATIQTDGAFKSAH